MWVIYDGAPHSTARKNYFFDLMPIADFPALPAVELNAVRRRLLCTATVHRSLAVETFCLFRKRAQVRSRRDRARFITQTVPAVESVSTFAVSEIALRIEAPKNMIRSTVEWVQSLRGADSPAARIPTTCRIAPNKTVISFVLSDSFPIPEKSLLFRPLIHDTI